MVGFCTALFTVSMKGLKEDGMLGSRLLCTGSDMTGREKESTFLIFQPFLLLFSNVSKDSAKPRKNS